MKNWKLSLLLVVPIVLSSLSVRAACAEELHERPPLTGRIETFAGNAEPVLPADLLGQTARPGREPLSSGLTQTGSLPENLRGEWFGKVTISQMATYPSLHPEPYCQSFIEEINHFFHTGKGGQISLIFKPGLDGALTVASSDIVFARGLRVQLTAQEGPAMVPGGVNNPHPVRDDVTQLSENRFEQTRIDLVKIVDKARRRLIHTGFTEVTAQYEIVAPRRMRIKILNVDYDQDGNPLWKGLMEGELRRWTRGW